MSHNLVKKKSWPIWQIFQRHVSLLWSPGTCFLSFLGNQTLHRLCVCSCAMNWLRDMIWVRTFCQQLILEKFWSVSMTPWRIPSHPKAGGFMDVAIATWFQKKNGDQYVTTYMCWLFLECLWIFLESLYVSHGEQVWLFPSRVCLIVTWQIWLPHLKNGWGSECSWSAILQGNDICGNNSTVKTRTTLVPGATVSGEFRRRCWPRKDITLLVDFGGHWAISIIPPVKVSKANATEKGHNLAECHVLLRVVFLVWHMSKGNTCDLSIYQLPTYLCFLHVDPPHNWASTTIDVLGPGHFMSIKFIQLGTHCLSIAYQAVVCPRCPTLPNYIPPSLWMIFDHLSPIKKRFQKQHLKKSFSWSWQTVAVGSLLRGEDEACTTVSWAPAERRFNSRKVQLQEDQLKKNTMLKYAESWLVLFAIW